jgi:hypothetical protein
MPIVAAQGRDLVFAPSGLCSVARSSTRRHLSGLETGASEHGHQGPGPARLGTAGAFVELAHGSDDVLQFGGEKARRPRPAGSSFELTEVWLHADYPLIEVGRMTLDRNPSEGVPTRVPSRPP